MNYFQQHISKLSVDHLDLTSVDLINKDSLSLIQEVFSLLAEWADLDQKELEIHCKPDCSSRVYNLCNLSGIDYNHDHFIYLDHAYKIDFDRLIYDSIIECLERSQFLYPRMYDFMKCASMIRSKLKQKSAKEHHSGNIDRAEFYTKNSTVLKHWMNTCLYGIEHLIRDNLDQDIFKSYFERRKGIARELISEALPGSEEICFITDCFYVKFNENIDWYDFHNRLSIRLAVRFSYISENSQQLYEWGHVASCLDLEAIRQCFLSPRPNMISYDRGTELDPNRSFKELSKRYPSLVKLD